MLLANGHWSLAIGFWRLATGYSQATGYWLLASGKTDSSDIQKKPVTRSKQPAARSQ
jgi:hypothetical protein